MVAWDPVAAEPAWIVPFPQAFNGGTLSTDGGLVFQGNKRGEFVAYDASTGERVWSQRLVGDAAAAPMTYELDGEQYVSVLSGWGNVSMMIYGAALEKPVNILWHSARSNTRGKRSSPTRCSRAAPLRSSRSGAPRAWKTGCQQPSRGVHFESCTM